MTNQQPTKEKTSLMYAEITSKVQTLWSDVYNLKKCSTGKRYEILQQVSDLLFIAGDTLLLEELNGDMLDEKLGWGRGCTRSRVEAITTNLQTEDFQHD